MAIILAATFQVKKRGKITMKVIYINSKTSVISAIEDVNLINFINSSRAVIFSNHPAKDESGNYDFNSPSISENVSIPVGDLISIEY